MTGPFITLTDEDGKPILVNLAHLRAVRPNIGPTSLEIGEHSRLYFSDKVADERHAGVVVRESFEEVRVKIIAAVDRPTFPLRDTHR